ncbi:hypothetical protein [Bacillus sp. FJAT-28004]|uniref:hypothetical protein n=1 Tax=Bacillus sp. FJAT-28004 TaxID=1679165 RepID=UPI0006B65058|nr:hypothetical protein [Bacillus sp. FJAT-28004]
MKNFKLVLLILVCFGISACSNSSNNHKQPIHTGSDILKTFGDEDLIRMKEFVDRFNNKKSDYVLAIPPFLDGGYSIYDLISDGKLVTIKRDSTRDIYGVRYPYVTLTGNVSSMEQRQSRILFSRPWLSLSREKIVLDWRQLEKALIMLEY